MSKDELEEVTKSVTEVLTNKSLLATKEVLTLEEVAQYMGVSKSYLYKLTMNRQIPHYKPNGKMTYFNRREVEEWLQSIPVPTDEKLNQKALAVTEK
ncbi:MAG: helix-turn-helix domain-containing protein [Bacteroidales bacterium]|nr:helix-turn-helix domain-containing protein [Bacteroidales bacterium]